MELKWWKSELACGTTRYQLYDGHTQTPYFIDKAKYRAHQGWPGMATSLHGAGMGQMTSAGYRIAATFGGFKTIREAKNEAKQRYNTEGGREDVSPQHQNEAMAE